MPSHITQAWRYQGSEKILDGTNMKGFGDQSWGASQVVLLVKNPPANTGDVREVGMIPRLGRSLKKKMATYSSILAWRIPWTERLGELQSTGLHRVRHD